MEDHKNQLSNNVFEEFEKNIKEKVKIIYTELMRDIRPDRPDISDEVEDEYEQKVKQKIKSSFTKLIEDVQKSFKLFSKLFDDDKQTSPFLKQVAFKSAKKVVENKSNKSPSKTHPIILVDHDEFGQTVYSTLDDLEGVSSPLKTIIKVKDKHDKKDESYVLPPTLQAIPIKPEGMIEKSKKLLKTIANGEDDAVDNICDECGYLGTSKEQLKRHLKYAHPHSSDEDPTYNPLKSEHPITNGGEIFSCPQCDFKGENKYTVTSHIKGVHGPKDYKCRICSYATSIKYNLVLHIKNTHTSSDPNNAFKCLKCDYTASTSRILNKHNTAIHVKQGADNQEFESKSEFIINPKKFAESKIDAKESIKRIFNGDNVDSIYPDFGGLQKKETKPLVASDLSRIVPAGKLSDLDSKLRSVNPKSMDQSKVQDSFSGGDEIPLDSIKTEVEEEFETEADDTSIGPDDQPNEDSTAENEPVKPIKRRRRRRKLDPSQKVQRKEKLVYDCDLCDQTGFLRKDFRMHIALVHTDPEKLLHCSQPGCDYVADAQYNMNSHVKGVHGDKIFQCNDCSYSTSKKFNLVLHCRNQHTVKNPEDQYRCTQCDYSSPDIKYLKKHYTVTHEKSSPIKCEIGRDN